MTGLKLNLGCGERKFSDFVNVDKFGDPDVKHDLEVFPWPWPDDSVSEIRLIHVLEHLGHDPKVFLNIIKEIYRVCEKDAKITIVVPHYRHDFFANDPTHVRPVTPEALQLFSQRLNREWIDAQKANSPLGLYMGVDLELVSTNYRPSQHWQRLHPEMPIDLQLFLQEAALHNNLIEQIEMELRVVK